MIKRLEIKNFQSHRNTVISFDKGVNVIAGRSDSGKSAIIRALRWVLMNEPSGDAFRSYWGGETSVKLEFIGSDGNTHIIERIRDDSRNLYIIDGQEFAGFGKEVPSIIKELFPFSELNLQRQFDPPFALSASPSELGSIISQMFGFDYGQDLLSLLGKKKWALNDSLKSEKKRLQDVKAKIEKLDWVNKAKAIWDKTKKLIQKREEVSDRIERLLKLVDDYTTISSEYERYNWVEEAGKYYEDLSEAAQKSANIYNEAKELEEAVERFTELSKRYKQLAWVKEATKYYSRLEAQLAEIDELQEKISMLESLASRYKKVESEFSAVGKKLEQLENEFHEQLGEVCPLCGQPIMEAVK